MEKILVHAKTHVLLLVGYHNFKSISVLQKCLAVYYQVSKRIFHT